MTIVENKGQQSSLAGPGVGQRVDDDRPVTQLLRCQDGLYILPGFKGRIDGAGVIKAQVIVKLPGTPLRVDQAGGLS